MSITKTTSDLPRFERISIDKLKPYPNNARTHSADQIEKLRASIREFGFVNPCLIDADYGIIAGHGRVEAARLEGMPEVPCVFVEHLTPEQKRAYILADNKLAELAGWDMEMLKVELGALNDLDFDLDTIGFADFDFKTDDPKPADDTLKPKDKHRCVCPQCGCEFEVTLTMGSGM